MPAIIAGTLISRLTKKSMKLVMLKANKNIAYINELFESARIKPIIDGPYSFTDLPKAMKLFGEGKHKGKVVISLD